MKEYELGEVNRPNNGQYAEQGPRVTNTALAVEFQRMRQTMKNVNDATQSRKTSRLTKGLNPDVPRP
jgi:hypothetical protein